MSRKVIDKIKAKFPDAVIESGVAMGDAFAMVKRGSYFDVVKFLKEDPDCLMNHFIDLTCVDWPDREDRFEVVLHLRSQALNHRVRIKTVAAAVDPSVASVVPIFRGANWFEREAFDMYGVKFEGHPDMRRLLLWEGFEGHPLRKDYPKNRRQCPTAMLEDFPKQPPPFGERS